MESATLNQMALIRVISGLLEIITAVIFIKVGRLDMALRLNAMLGLIGPIIFILVSVLGIAAIAVKLSWSQMTLVCLGVGLIIWGTQS